MGNHQCFDYKMPASCIAGGCKNTRKGGFSLHVFPKAPESIRRSWIQFVRTKRAKWTVPTENSLLCSAHFKPDDFDSTYLIMKQLMPDTKCTVKLKDGAVPSIHSSTNYEPPKKKQRLSKAAHKLDINRVSLENYLI